jgi:tRNA G18 (ribose-2'-O)-methylase SpoU
MKHPVESLNTAVAAGLLVYEACRQRRTGFTAGR